MTDRPEGNSGETKDVRMRGFRERVDVEAVLKLIDRRTAPLPNEPVSILEVAGRVLAREAIAMVDVPAFDRSAMDGYAVIAEETYGATPDDPRPLTIVGESFPAHPSEAVVVAGSCVRIMTGAPMPDGADAVVAVERTERAGETVRVHEPVTPGKNVGAVGEDVRKGSVIHRPGRRLRPQDAGLLSALGFKQVSVVRRPRVSVVITGNEVLPPGSMPEGYRIVDANTPMLIPLIRRDGGTPLTGPIVPDDRESLREALQVSAEQADCILVSGGSSVGEGDHAPSLLREVGELPVHGVAMRPSSPAGVGFLHETPVFLLPGNPVSCLCAYDFFAGRAIRRMAGLKAGWPHTVLRMPLKRKIASALGRTDYVRVRIEESRVVPLAIRGASILSSTTRAHGFVIVEKDDEGHAEGTPVSVHLY
ncbi:MAG: molybdopterin molybdotransferase MoeA [Planctomycetota bacterium]|jgi:molybdopterin molybdotransferase